LIEGEGIVEADFSHIFQVEGEAHLNYEHVTEDNVHFTPIGYDAWADAIVPVIDDLIT